MANSILKLKVESEEYDAKLKKAAEGIRHLAEVAHKGGGELTGLEKAELDYIKALGDMETKSRTAAGSTRELENAFKELTVIYNNLNDVEKADEGGKALAASLEKLKQRTIDAKSQLDAATKSLQSNESAGQSNSSALEQLASKFTVNIDALKLFNIGLQALDAALQRQLANIQAELFYVQFLPFHRQKAQCGVHDYLIFIKTQYLADAGHRQPVTLVQLQTVRQLAAKLVVTHKKDLLMALVCPIL